MRRGSRLLAASCGVVAAIAGIGPALAQQQGGVLRIFSSNSPASMSIHEEFDALRGHAGHGRVQQSRAVRPAHSAEQLRDDPAGAGRELVVGRGPNRTDLHAAARRNLARRPTLHRSRCEMHLGFADRQRGAEIARQPAQILVSQSRCGDHRGGLPRHVPPEAAATIIAGAARLRRLAGLSVPCPAGADANAPDRHRTVQIRRVQAEREYQTGPQSGLLEEGSALSRRDRIFDRPEPRDAGPGLHGRQVRHEFSVRRHNPAAEGSATPGAGRSLRPYAR